MATKIPFTLPENLGISNISVLHDEMEAFLHKCDSEEIVFKADAVTNTDTAGMQMLLAMVEATKQRHIKVSWQQPSAALTQAAELLGLSKLLEFS